MLLPDKTRAVAFVCLCLCSLVCRDSLESSSGSRLKLHRQHNDMTYWSRKDVKLTSGDIVQSGGRGHCLYFCVWLLWVGKFPHIGGDKIIKLSSALLAIFYASFSFLSRFWGVQSHCSHHCSEIMLSFSSYCEHCVLTTHTKTEKWLLQISDTVLLQSKCSQ